MRKSSKFYSDYYRMTGNTYKPSPKTLLQRFFFHNLQFAFHYRKYKEKENVFSRLVLYRLSRKYGLEISPKAEIGEGMYLGHPYNITIGEGVVIGNNVNLHKGCTIGKTNRGDRGSPIIGNCVFIGVNATVVGNIHIGDDVLIAPNSYINFNVPNHSIVIGNPGTIHYRRNATKDYVSFRVRTYGENDEENTISYS